MKFNGKQFMQPCRDLEGKEFKRQGDSNPEERVDLTVKHALRIALTARANPNAAPVDPKEEEKKFEYYELARKIVNCGPDDTLELTSEEIGTIKRKCRAIWDVEVYGFLNDVLEGKNREYADISIHDKEQK